MISSGKIDWPKLVADAERLGIAVEQEEQNCGTKQDAIKQEEKTSRYKIARLEARFRDGGTVGSRRDSAKMITSRREVTFACLPTGIKMSAKSCARGR
jgi:hypothetical protein